MRLGNLRMMIMATLVAMALVVLTTGSLIGGPVASASDEEKPDKARIEKVEKDRPEQKFDVDREDLKERKLDVDKKAEADKKADVEERLAGERELEDEDVRIVRDRDIGREELLDREAVREREFEDEDVTILRDRDIELEDLELGDLRDRRLAIERRLGIEAGDLEELLEEIEFRRIPVNRLLLERFIDRDLFRPFVVDRVDRILVKRLLLDRLLERRLVDDLEIEKARFDLGDRELEVEVFSFDLDQRIVVFDTSSGERIGSLTPEFEFGVFTGVWEGKFFFPLNPGTITAVSTTGATDTASVETK